MSSSAAVAATVAVLWTHGAIKRRLANTRRSLLDIEEGELPPPRALSTCAPSLVDMDESLPTALREWLERYVGEGKAAGMSAIVARHGKIVANVGVGAEILGENMTRPFTSDSLVRMYSMTKPLTTVAVLQLVERGLVELDAPVSRYLPVLEGQWRVLITPPVDSAAPAKGFPTGASDDGSDDGGMNELEASIAAAGLDVIVPAKREPTVRELLSNTSGLSYGFWNATSVDAWYREARLELPHKLSAHVDARRGEAPCASLAEVVTRLAALPAQLTFQPGEGWQYSLGTDVLGALVEAVSGESFDDYIYEHITQPLSMAQTSFAISEEIAEEELAACYTHEMSGSFLRLVRLEDGAGYVRRAVGEEDDVLGDDAAGSAETSTTRTHLPSGGGGLVGTARDYLRFTQALLNGGILDGNRILSAASVAAMSSDDLIAPGTPASRNVGAIMGNHTKFGFGFGLGVKVVRETGAAGRAGRGTSGWGGAAGTVFWYDPLHGIAAVLATQVRPHSLMGTPRCEFAQIVFDAVRDVDPALPHTRKAYSGF